MLPSPWSVLFTLIFCATGAYALLQVVRLAGRPAAEGPTGRVVELNHLVMSVLMVGMLWWLPGTLGTAVQVIALGLFAIALLRYAVLPGLARGTRIALGAHLAGNLAMIWMLAAMPRLMGHGATSGAGGDHADHSGHTGHGAAAAPAAGAGSGTELAAATPGWMIAISLALAVLLAVTAIGWLVHRHRDRDLPRGDDWPHRICHAAMAGGMAAMLVIMR